MLATSCCLQLCEGRRWWRAFILFFGRVGRGTEKVCVTNWGKWGGGKRCGNEERRGEEGRVGWGGWGGGVCVKKCRVEGFGRAESALMQTLWGANHTLTHTHTHTCTQASNAFCCSTVRYIFHIRMSYWAEAALGTATPCCTVRLLHGLTELD